jgi:hypothetical protein
MTVEVDRAPLQASLLVTVAWVGNDHAKLAAVRARLFATSDDESVEWRVVDAELITAPDSVQLAVCTEAGKTSACVQRWPQAAVLTLVADRDDERATLAALTAGAAVCVRGSDPALIVAFLRSMGRRQLAGEPLP